MKGDHGDLAVSGDFAFLYRLDLAMRVRRALTATLDTVGIEVPEKM